MKLPARSSGDSASSMENDESVDVSVVSVIASVVVGGCVVVVGAVVVVLSGRMIVSSRTIVPSVGSCGVEGVRVAENDNAFADQYALAHSASLPPVLLLAVSAAQTRYSLRLAATLAKASDQIRSELRHLVALARRECLETRGRCAQRRPDQHFLMKKKD